MLATACGYSFGSGLRDENVRSVFVHAVANDTFRQRLEAELGAAVARELPRSSDLVPGTRGAADADLELRIVDDRERTLVTGDRTAPVREGAQETAVHLRLVARSSGRVLVDTVVRDRAEFRDPIGENLDTARRELVDDLARKIVLALETGF